MASKLVAHKSSPQIEHPPSGTTGQEIEVATGAVVVGAGFSTGAGVFGTGAGVFGTGAFVGTMGAGVLAVGADVVGTGVFVTGAGVLAVGAGVLGTGAAVVGAMDGGDDGVGRTDTGRSVAQAHDGLIISGKKGHCDRGT